MKKKYKLKINGESPRSLLLANVLAKLNCEVYIYDFLRNHDSKKDYQIFLFSNTSKNLLTKFEIWNEIEDISYGFTSLSIKDDLISEQLLLRTENFSKKYLDILGWTTNYSDIKKLLINKLINYDNVHFISKNQLKDKSLIFDYELTFHSYFKNLYFFELPLLNFKKIDEQIFIFNVYLRGHIKKRLYEINTSKGSLMLIPLDNNLYQIIWNNSPFRIKECSHISKSFFLDNLTTLLPNELKVDQIVGEINSLPFNNIYSKFSIKNNKIYFFDYKSKSNIIHDFNFDMLIRNTIQIYNFLERNEPRKIEIANKFGFYYLLRKYEEININFSLPNYLFNLFRLNNILSIFIRKFLFALFKRINLIKKFFMSNLIISNINNLIK